ncbi:hypothetical protein [Pacificoceanicola onchidii]|uniref:hypothetical protein n=1 Tax=Pacificoceanicola onchidii TaxID=2562685 RepID=UPI0010A57541|nr:hypothetical protein [Pacificoceanicola onchidii]
MDGLIKLGVQTVTAPNQVARLLLSLRLPTEALLLGFALAIICNALIYAMAIVLTAPAGLAGALGSPLALMGLRAVLMLATMAGFTVVGLFLGGKAKFRDIALLLIWLNLIGLVPQAALSLLQPLFGGITNLLAFGVAALGAYICVAFIDEAHGFSSPIKAVAVLILGLVAATVGLSFLLGLMGFTPTGLTGNV